MKHLKFGLLFFLPLLFIIAVHGKEKTTGVEMTHETTNFIIITYEEDPAYLTEIITSLEDNYDHIVGSLQMESKLSKITVKIYPTIEAFHKAINMEGAPNWVLGTITGSAEFSMASPESQGLPVSYTDMTQRLPLHEFTHVVVYNIVNPEKIPYWLWEGISLYMAGQRVDLSKDEDLKAGNFPQFDDLASMQNSFRLGYSIVEFIDNKWGIQTLHAFLKSEGDVVKTYNISINDFYREWINFVSQNYF